MSPSYDKKILSDLLNATFGDAATNPGLVSLGNNVENLRNFTFDSFQPVFKTIDILKYCRKFENSQRIEYFFK